MDHLTSHDPQTPSDDVILNQAPPLPVHPKLALLDEATILRVSNTSNVNDVKVHHLIILNGCDKCSLVLVQNLNLHGNHLMRFRVSSCPSSLTHSLLPSLTHLTLSCNELQVAEDFQRMVSRDLIGMVGG